MVISNLGYWPYSLALKYTILLSKLYNLKVQIWARNSYKLKALEPGYSDLDITISIEKNCNRKRLYSFMYLYKKTQKFFSIFGEINIYNEDVIQFLLKNHNSFELMRDPTLCINFNFNRTPDSVEAAVFLFRNLEADLHNLQNNPKKRIKKWRSHFDMINNAIPELRLAHQIHFNEDKLLETVIFCIIYLSNTRSLMAVDELKDKLYFYFELLSKKVDFVKITYLMNADSWFAIWKSFRDIEANVIINNFSDKKIQFFICQLKWEVCGVLTQINSKTAADAAIVHFNKITLAVQRINHLYSSEEIKTVLININEAIFIAKKIQKLPIL